MSETIEKARHKAFIRRTSDINRDVAFNYTAISDGYRSQEDAKAALHALLEGDLPAPPGSAFPKSTSVITDGRRWYLQRDLRRGLEGEPLVNAHFEGPTLVVDNEEGYLREIRAFKTDDETPLVVFCGEASEDNRFRALGEAIEIATEDQGASTLEALLLETNEPPPNPLEGTPVKNEPVEGVTSLDAIVGAGDTTTLAAIVGDAPRAEKRRTPRFHKRAARIAKDITDSQGNVHSSETGQFTEKDGSKHTYTPDENHKGGYNGTHETQSPVPGKPGENKTETKTTQTYHSSASNPTEAHTHYLSHFIRMTDGSLSPKPDTQFKLGNGQVKTADQLASQCQDYFYKKFGQVLSRKECYGAVQERYEDGDYALLGEEHPKYKAPKEDENEAKLDHPDDVDYHTIGGGKGGDEDEGDSGVPDGPKVTRDPKTGKRTDPLAVYLREKHGFEDFTDDEGVPPESMSDADATRIVAAAEKKFGYDYNGNPIKGKGGAGGGRPNIDDETEQISGIQRELGEDDMGNKVAPGKHPPGPKGEHGPAWDEANDKTQAAQQKGHVAAVAALGKDIDKLIDKHGTAYMSLGRPLLRVRSRIGVALKAYELGATDRARHELDKAAGMVDDLMGGPHDPRAQAVYGPLLDELTSAVSSHDHVYSKGVDAGRDKPDERRGNRRTLVNEKTRRGFTAGGPDRRTARSERRSTDRGRSARDERRTSGTTGEVHPTKERRGKLPSFDKWAQTKYPGSDKVHGYSFRSGDTFYRIDAGQDKIGNPTGWTADAVSDSGKKSVSIGTQQLAPMGRGVAGDRKHYKTPEEAYQAIIAHHAKQTGAEPNERRPGSDRRAEARVGARQRPEYPMSRERRASDLGRSARGKPEAASIRTLTVAGKSSARGVHRLVADHNGKRYSIEAQVFDEPSSYGIPGHRRVSRLNVRPYGPRLQAKGDVLNYDRGWDKSRPNTPELKTLAAAILRHLDNIPAEQRKGERRTGSTAFPNGGTAAYQDRRLAPDRRRRDLGRGQRGQTQKGDAMIDAGIDPKALASAEALFKSKFDEVVNEIQDKNPKLSADSARRIAAVAGRKSIGAKAMAERSAEARAKKSLGEPASIDDLLAADTDPDGPTSVEDLLKADAIAISGTGYGRILDGSLEELLQRVRDPVLAGSGCLYPPKLDQAGAVIPPDYNSKEPRHYPRIVGTYPDFCIVECDECKESWKVPFAMDEDGKVTTGQPLEAEAEYRVVGTDDDPDPDRGEETDDETNEDDDEEE